MFNSTRCKNRKKFTQRIQLMAKTFWEHAIRNEKDYGNHVNYIHSNPVKHRYVKHVCD